MSELSYPLSWGFVSILSMIVLALSNSTEVGGKVGCIRSYAFCFGNCKRFLKIPTGEYFFILYCLSLLMTVYFKEKT